MEARGTETDESGMSGQFVHVKVEPWYEIMESEPHIVSLTAGAEFDLPPALPEKARDLPVPPLVRIRNKPAGNVYSSSKRRSSTTGECPPLVKIRRDRTSSPAGEEYPPPLVRIRSGGKAAAQPDPRPAEELETCFLPPLVRIRGCTPEFENVVCPSGEVHSDRGEVSDPLIPAVECSASNAAYFLAYRGTQAFLVPVGLVPSTPNVPERIAN